MNRPELDDITLELATVLTNASVLLKLPKGASKKLLMKMAVPLSYMHFLMSECPTSPALQYALKLEEDKAASGGSSGSESGYSMRGLKLQAGPNVPCMDLSYVEKVGGMNFYFKKRSSPASKVPSLDLQYAEMIGGVNLVIGSKGKTGQSRIVRSVIEIPETKSGPEVKDLANVIVDGLLQQSEAALDIWGRSKTGDSGADEAQDVSAICDRAESLVDGIVGHATYLINEKGLKNKKHIEKLKAQGGLYKDFSHKEKPLSTGKKHKDKSSPRSFTTYVVGHGNVDNKSCIDVWDNVNQLNPETYFPSGSGDVVMPAHLQMTLEAKKQLEMYELPDTCVENSSQGFLTSEFEDIKLVTEETNKVESRVEEVPVSIPEENSKAKCDMHSLMEISVEEITENSDNEEATFHKRKSRRSRPQVLKYARIVAHWFASRIHHLNRKRKKEPISQNFQPPQTAA